MEVDPIELKMGIEDEMEHTDDRKVAEQIARDHLEKDPRYYTKLKQSGLARFSAAELGEMAPRKNELPVVRATVEYVEMPEFVLIKNLPSQTHRMLVSTMGNLASDIHDDAVSFPYNKAPDALQFLKTMGVHVKVIKISHAMTGKPFFNPVTNAYETSFVRVYAEEQKGVMVCFYPPRDVAEQFAVEGGEAVENMHITLAYLGKIDELPEDYAERVKKACEEAVNGQSPISGEIGGIGRWAAGEDGDVVYASVDLPGSNEFRTKLSECLQSAGVPARNNHGWTAHMTIQYLDGHEPKVKISHVDPVKVSFDSIWLVIGDEERQEVKFPKKTAQAAGIDSVGGRVGEPVETGPASIIKKVGAFNVLQRRGLERQRIERELQTVLENQRDGVLQDHNAKRIKDRTGLDPKKEKDRKELKKQINVSPPSGATAELERMIAEKLGWW